MEDTKPHYDDEIDLVELFQTIWDGKWKIIATTFIAAIIGVVFSVVKPNSFEVSTPIQIGKQSVFLQYTPLNDLLKKEGMLFDNETNPNGYSIDSDSIFKQFVIEFNNYEELIDAVSSSEYVKETIKDYDDIDKNKALIEFAKSFELRAPSKNDENWFLFFEWPDDIEGVRILNDAMQKMLLNIRNDSKSDIDVLATAIEIRNTQELEILRNELRLIQEKIIDRNKKRIQYLIEQSEIAKELGIETNRLDANALSQSSQNGISLSVSSNDVPFYLRGYRAIDKEISLIQMRTEEEKLLSASGYLEIKEKIFSLEKDLSSSQLRNASEVIAIDDPNDWVEFDLAIAEIKSQKKTILYVALSIVIGGIIGAIYVLISSAIRKRKEQLVKV
jgi:LPS O-antigen subunit length determinant protein (WzzB/FepE family)